MINVYNYANNVVDINECDKDNGHCSQICTNTFGSYDCSCEEGYTLDFNGFNCTGRYNIAIARSFYIACYNTFASQIKGKTSAQIPYCTGHGMFI